LSAPIEIRALHKDEILSAINQAASSDAKELMFCDQEIIQHPDFPEIMRKLVDCKLAFGIETNAVAFNRRSIAERLARFGLKEAQVTFYGGTRFSYQLVSGRDEFVRATAGLKNLLDSGVSCRIKFPVRRDNHGTLKMMLASLQALKGWELDFVPDENIDFSGDIARALEYEDILDGTRSPRIACAQNFAPTDTLVKLDIEACPYKLGRPLVDDRIESHLLLEESPQHYRLYSLSSDLPTREIVRTKNVRELVFMRDEEGNRHRLRLKDACCNCRKLTSCHAAFEIEKETVNEDLPVEYKGIRRESTSSGGGALRRIMLGLEPSTRLLVEGRAHYFMLGGEDETFDIFDFDIGPLSDLAAAANLEAVDYRLCEHNGSEHFYILYERLERIRDKPERMAVANISSACIANCIMCSMPQVFRGSTLPTPRVRGLMEELKVCGFEMFDTFGGEISMRGDLVELIRYVKELNMISNIISTGYQLDEDYVARLLEAGIDKVQISIDSPDAELHDMIRGTEGLFEHAVKAAGLFAKSGKVFLEINSVILPDNIHQIRELHRFVVNDLGISNHRLFYCVQVPTALTQPRWLSIEQAREYFESTYPALLQDERQLGSVIDFCPPIMPEHYKDKEELYDEVAHGRYNRLGRCEAPERDLFITPEGELYPCVNPSIINRVKPLGRLGDIKIVHALKSEAMQEAIANAGNWPECASCISRR